MIPMLAWMGNTCALTREYKGEIRQRLQGCGRLTPEDYTTESKWLISKISAFNQAT